MKSYFIDTNYFLRLLLKDNIKQFNQVYNLFQEAVKEKVDLYTSIIVFFEIYWVLSSFYKKNKLTCVSYLEKILRMEFLNIENRDILRTALKLYQSSSLELEDCYNISFSIKNDIKDFAT